ncbi:MAG: class I SAM-dependent methyltransferase [Campylobacterales bacterium]|nr:class I SAM-dependent methyltransferase [Campylobacterales bacterium]
MLFRRLAIRTAHDRQRLIYKDLHRRFSANHKALHWSNPDNQILRFMVLEEMGNLKGRKVLDIGSGLGDFYNYLHAKNIKCRYTGYDIVDEFILEAKKRYRNAHFENRNILMNRSHERFDYVFSSGLFAFGNTTFFQEMIKEALSISRFGYAFNVYKPEYDDDFFSVDVEDVLRFCKTLDLGKVVYKDNYLKNDTTFFLYK